MKKHLLLWLFVSSLTTFAQQGITNQSNVGLKKITIEDAIFGYYKNPDAPQGYSLLYPENYYDLQWIKNTNQWIHSSNGKFNIIDANGKTIRTLGDELMKNYPQLKRLPSIGYIDEKEFIFEADNTYHIYDYQSDKKTGSIRIPQEADNKDLNRERNAVAYTIGNNLYLAIANNEKIVITNHSDKNIVSGQSIHRQEFGIKKGTFWSPKGNFLAFYQKNESNVTDYPLVDINTHPAVPKIIKYPMVGQKSEQASIGIFNVDTQKTIYLDIDTTDEHYLTNLSWSPDEKYVLIAEINRDQNHYWLNRYDVATGKKVNTLFEEKNDKWVEPENPAVFLPNKNNEFLWMSERDGFMNLYHYNIEGKLIKKLTSFRWVVQDILGFDSKGKYVYISGTGTDPREKHTFRIDLTNPKKIQQLTKVNGTHKTQLSSDGKYLIDVYSSISIPNKIDIINTESTKSITILEAKNPLEGVAVGSTEFVEIKANDGTILYGKMHKPRDIDVTKKYPVLLYVYGGPHAQLVTNSWGVGSYLWMPFFAENEQYIIFTIDNRGSANRGFAFESVIHRRLGDIEIQDQLTGVEYLKSLPYVDDSRIAVHGWSFGGFMASSLMLRHPNVFTTSIAGGAVTDWKFYEVMYGERYMDTPISNPEGYEKSRVGKYLDNLSGKLLFVHGSVDDVVVPQHVMSIIQESISKRKMVDLSIYPMHGHGVRGVDNVNLVIRMLEYIKQHNK